MDRGRTVAPYVALEPLSLRAHATTEPAVVVVLLAAPFLLGFADVRPALLTSLVAGVAVAVLGLTTRWRWAPVRRVTLGVHALVDTVLGLALLSAPFLLEYHDDTTAGWIVHVVIGLAVLAVAWGTDWRRTERPLPPSVARLDHT